MTDKKLCRSCGATVEHHGMFCINCGAPVDGSEGSSHGDNEAHTPTALQTENVLDEIAKLASLRDKGVVTEKEFQEQRRKLLETLTADQSQHRFDPSRL